MCFRLDSSCLVSTEAEGSVKKLGVAGWVPDTQGRGRSWDDDLGTFGVRREPWGRQGLGLDGLVDAAAGRNWNRRPSEMADVVHRGMMETVDHLLDVSSSQGPPARALRGALRGAQYCRR
jgi:hypothetical protein